MSFPLSGKEDDEIQAKDPLNYDDQHGNVEDTVSRYLSKKKKKKEKKKKKQGRREAKGKREKREQERV